MQSEKTAEIMRRFNDAFLQHEPEALGPLVAEDCIIEGVAPAPDGARYVGREVCLKLWQGIATEPGTHFDLEDVYVAGTGQSSDGVSGGALSRAIPFVA